MNERIAFKTWLRGNGGPNLLRNRPHPQCGNGEVRINFATDNPLKPAPLAFTLTPDEAREFARQLIHVANSSEGGS